MTLNPKAKSNGDAQAVANDEEGSPAFVLHRQRALHKEAGGMLDAGKRMRAQKVKKVDELAREENLSLESRIVLQNAARTFLETAFNCELAEYLHISRYSPYILQHSWLLC